MTMAGMRRRGYIENHPAKQAFLNGEEMNKFDKEGFQRVEFDPNNDGTNTTNEKIMEQVSINIRRQLPQVMPHAANKEIVALVCGGPSLAKTKKELVELVWSGAKVVALNGAYQWCIDNNIRPSAMIMLDARPFNSRFVETPVNACHYFLASQCHPDAFDKCKDRDVYIWHCCSGGEIEYAMLKDYYFGRTFPIGLGTTVSIKAIQLMNLLGFKSFDIFGLDSCWLGDNHHGYSQQENDKDGHRPVWLSPDDRPDLAEKFYCAPWHMRQAEDFQNLICEQGDKFRLNVRGDGLIAAILRISATLGLASTLKEGE